MTIALADIRAAALAIKGNVTRTPLVPMTGQVRLKLENLQLSGSFKARGALNRLLALTGDERRAGVVAMSAGNHAQGVAWHARALGIPATIVMPVNTPFSKIERTEALGATVVTEGESLTEAGNRAKTLAAAEGWTFIHPYDDPLIIAGQGTIGLELWEDWPEIQAVIVPIGGGGLIAGIAIALKALNPDIEIIGVQTELYPSMKDALDGTPPRCGGQTIAEGIAVKAPGLLTQPIIRELVSEIILVNEAAVERAALSLMENQKIVAEGAAAAALAALWSAPERFAERPVALVISGGNMDGRLMASILLRGQARAGRMARLRIEIPDTPGMLARIAKIIGDGDGNIIEITHQRLFYEVPVKYTEIDAVIETTSTSHVGRIIDLLKGAGFPTRLLSSTA